MRICKPKNIFAIVCCFAIAFGFYFFSNFIKANPGARIEFTADTIIDLSGLDTTLYALEGSECDSISVSGSTLVVGIPDASSFTLGTADHNVLRLTPSGGTVILTFDSTNFSSGYVSQWTEESSISDLEVTHLIGTSKANTWYEIKVDNVLFNSFQTNSSGELTFTYDGGYSPKTFIIEEDTTAPTEFSLVSPVNNDTTSNSKPSFSWNACADPDLSYYQLYIDGALDTDNITNTSVTSTNDLSCGSHTWYVRALDKAGNTTESTSIFTIVVDYCPPTGTTLDFGTITSDSIEVQVSGAVDNVTGLHSSPYYFIETSLSDNSGWQSETSWTHPSLSENTQYAYQVKARDNIDTPNESDFTVAQSKYTLADAPTNLTSTDASTETINLSVASFPNATSGFSGYYFYRSDDETNHNSGWIQTNTWQDTGLNCSTNYTYTVKYRNGDGVKTDTISLIASTDPCGTVIIFPQLSVPTPAPEELEATEEVKESIEVTIQQIKAQIIIIQQRIIELIKQLIQLIQERINQLQAQVM